MWNVLSNQFELSLSLVLSLCMFVCLQVEEEEVGAVLLLNSCWLMCNMVVDRSTCSGSVIVCTLELK